ncbi:TetR/AcrR family transcriptional regulator [Risungbinella massiliensis]|uniref:TetR/AcrR family transcriptional regulator n=1 Tax=Risungbinella massiliensis TaxID=1329796 RepID=UPI0005CC740D|nr:TetR/AcrR family transcriptional regulator [Risungbinella massiliensis]
MAKPNVISKNELIEYAKECLVEKGIEKFTLKAVAEAGGVTQGTIYYHFRTKEQLLLEIVRDICDRSWSELSHHNENIIKQAFESAKSRCSSDSFFHKLFLTLVVSGFHNEKIKEQLGDILEKENEALSKHLTKIWSPTPIKGVSFETWGILLNAIVDGLAIQALLSKDFSVEKVYRELEQVLIGLSNPSKRECGK